jgi:predicted nucleic acid-binding protein
VTVGLDTSAAVRLLVGEPREQAEAARRLLDMSGKADPAAVSDLVVGETYFALRHHYRVPHRRAVGAMRALLWDARIGPTGVALEVLDALPDKETAPGLMDRLIHADYRRHGLELRTFDRDAAKLERARLIRA